MKRGWDQIVAGFNKVSQPQSAKGRHRKPRSLRAVSLETRITPAIGALNFPAVILPGNSAPKGILVDGVVAFVLDPVAGASQMNECSGSLTAGGRHILTAAHCVAGTTSTPVVFALPGRQETMNLSAADYRFVDATGNQLWNAAKFRTNDRDIALLKLPSVAPLDAQRYEINTKLVVNSESEVGQEFTFVGYCRTGTGATGESVAGGAKRADQNRVDAFGSAIGEAQQSLMYDFDNGLAANDLLGQRFGIHDLGFGAREGMQTAGESGGLAFIKRRIAGVSSYTWYDTAATDVNMTTARFFG